MEILDEYHRHQFDESLNLSSYKLMKYNGCMVIFTIPQEWTVWDNCFEWRFVFYLIISLRFSGRWHTRVLVIIGILVLWTHVIFDFLQSIVIQNEIMIFVFFYPLRVNFFQTHISIFESRLFCLTQICHFLLEEKQSYCDF